MRVSRHLRARSTFLISAMLVLAVPLSSTEVAGAREPAPKETKHSVSPAPVQRSGSAAGQPHEVGRSTNTTIPSSTRSRYPLLKPGAVPTGHNVASVPVANVPVVTGFDAGTSKELPARRTERQQSFANSDGTETTVFSDAPVNFLDGAGNWQPIKPAFQIQPGARNGLTSTGGAADITLARQLSPQAAVATLSLDANHSVAWRVAGARAALATVRGAVVSYPGFAAHADLELAASPAGIKETIVLRSADAPASYDFPLQLKGLTARLIDGEVRLSDAEGRVRAVIPAGWMEDSAAGTPATSTGVGYELVDTAAGQTLRVKIDSSWLRDPSRVYPVRVDPSVLQPTAGSALTVRAGGSSSGANTFDVGPKVAAYLGFGSVSTSLARHTIYGAQLSVVNQSSASCKSRPVTVHGVTAPWSSSSSVNFPGPAYSSTQLDSQSFAYGYVPPVGATSSPCPVRATLFNLGAAGRNLVQSWVNGGNNYGLTLRSPSSTDSLAAKTFAGPSSANPPRLHITHSPYNASYSIPNPVPAPPVLLNQDGVVKVAVTNKSADAWTPTTHYLGYRIFNSAGNPARDNTGALIGLVRTGTLPTTVARGAKLTLSATIKSPHVKGRYTLDFTMVKIGGPVFTDEQVPPGRLLLEVFDIPPVIKGAYPPNGYQTPTLTPQLYADGVDIDALTGSSLSYNYKVCPGADMASTACFSSGFQASPGWVIPAGKLVWGKSYSWIGQVRDASSTVDTPVITLLAEVPQPAITSRLVGAPYTAQDREFDPMAGNFSTAAIDAPVTTTGPDLSVSRTYNSLDPRTDGAFGAGWSSRYDMKVQAESDGSGNMLVTLPDGQQVRFGKNSDGTWTGPSSRKSTFSLINSTYLLKDVGGSSYTFSLSGKLTKIQGPWGNPLTLTYSADGTLRTVRSGNSGRTLTLTWSAGHVISAATMAVDGAMPTWTYTYSGDQLVKACAPDASCTSYTTSPGSRYRTVVLDAKPESYWRFGEDAGADAGSEIAVNLGKDVAKYTDVTLGTPGAIAGGGDTAVTLSGAASYVGLPTGTAKKGRDMAVELWFKTTASGPLVGYQEKALSAASANGVPLLYVGTDGKLRGQFRTGTISPITSAAAVNNGQWHHVVLSAMGAVQTMYLDGVVSGTPLTAAINHANLTYSQVGAAYATGAWPGYPTGALRYFTGSVDEAAVYAHPLGADVVAAHYRLGDTAAEVLSQVTLPSGKVASSMSYDPATERVSEYTDRNGGTWKLGVPAVTGGDTDLRRTVVVTDPAGRLHLYEFDAISGWALRTGTPTGISVRAEDQNCAVQPTPADPAFCAQDGTEGASQVIDASGLSIRSYEYHADGSLKRVTNEVGDFTDMTYDARQNITSKTTCRTSATDCGTVRYTFPGGFPDPLDPRWDKPLQMRDARSASATDNSYLTSYTYTAKGDLANQTSPDTGTVRNLYSSGVEAGYAGGVIPSGLPVSSTDARNAVTRFSYYANGDLAQITEPSGLITRFSYDPLGRKVAETEISDSYPAGVTTTFGYDALSRLTSTTGPATTDAVTGVRHQQQVNQVFDADGNVASSEVRDLLGGDASRITSYTYDDRNRLSSVIDPNENEITYGYDNLGNKTSMVDANGNRYDYAYTARNALAEVRLRDPDSNGTSSYLVLTSNAYDPAGRLAYQSDAMGRRIRFEYHHDDLVHRKVLENFHNPDGSVREYVLEENSYDRAGNLSRQAAANGTSVVTYTRDNVGRVKTSVLGAGTTSQTTSFSYDLAGNVTKVTGSGSASNLPWFSPVQTRTTSYVYDSSGRQTSQSVDLGGGSSQISTTGYDQRGKPIAVTEPRGNLTGATASDFTTNYGYDELGRSVSMTLPPVATEQDGAAPITRRPQTLTGYNSFSEVVEVKDPLGNIGATSYDKTGLAVRQTLPSYTPPGSSTPLVPVITMSYDGNGNLVSNVDARGFTTRYGYDRLGNVTKLDQPNSTDTDRAVSTFSYTRTGQVLRTVDPAGAITQQTYDDLDRPITSTMVERKPTLNNYTSTVRYDDNGNAVSVSSPSGAVTTSGYDTLGQLTSVTDPNGVITQFGYDGASNQVRITDGLGRTTKTVYDLGNRVTSESDLDSSLNVLRTQSYNYDVEGNLLTSTPGGQHPTSYVYDNTGQLVSQTDPVSDTKSISTSFGYNAAGDRTRYTDGRGNSTTFTFNSLGLPESVIQPATPAHPALADRTWTASYDAAAQPVTMTAPGGVSRQRSYDASGRLTLETGVGAEVSTAAKRIGYDVLGQVTSVGAAGGTDTFAYNDRGMQLSATGPSGTASYSYDGDGLLTQRTDASGTANFSYVKGRLSSETDPVGGGTMSVGYDASGAASSVDYGAGRVRSFSYDAFGRLQSDTLRNSTGAAVTSVNYGYDLDNNITSKSTAGVQGAGANTYTYDYLDRMTSWTNPAGTTTAYGWDDSSNRIQAGSKTASFDQRNRVINDGTSSYTYTARGSLRSKTTGASVENFSFDAFDRLINHGAQSYSYDDLDRLISAGGKTLQYAGTDPGVVSDGTSTYGRDGNGGLLSQATGTTKRSLISDQHGDVIGGFDTSDTQLSALADSRTYDPWGKVTAAAGTGSAVGFQGSWTDSSTGQINMSARWYSPDTGTFDSQDTVSYVAGASSLANKYLYGAGNPVTYNDPTGNWPSCGWCKKAVNKAKNAVSSAYHATTSFVSSAYHATTRFASKAWEFTKRVAKATWNVAKSAVRAVSHAVKWVYNKAASAVRTVVRAASSAARWVADRVSDGARWAAQKARQAAAAAHAAAVVVSKKTKAAITYAVQHNPLPAIKAAIKPLYEGVKVVVSAAANLPAAVVRVTVNVVKDAAASVQAVYHAAVTAAGYVGQGLSAAASAVTEFAQDHWKTIAAVAAGGATFLGCMAITAGAGSAGCVIAAAAVGGAVANSLNCPAGRSVAACAAKGAIAGGIGGAITVATGGSGGVLMGMVAAGGGAAAENATLQYLNTGEVDAGQVATSAVTGVALHGAGSGVSAMRGGSAKGSGGAAACSVNSFTAETPVLMADGSQKPISEVREGDQVLATDPETGVTAAQSVVTPIVHGGPHTMVEVSLSDGSTLTATDEHPFWNDTVQAFVNAIDLQVGDKVLTSSGQRLFIRAAKVFVAVLMAFNLAISTIHTYYAGATPVLVHNDCGQSPEARLDVDKYPEAGTHARDNSGEYADLTIDRPGAKMRRAESRRGHERVSGKDLDEWPPAMFKEGGAGASVRAINPSDNRGAGASLGNQCRGLPDGTVVRVRIC